MHTLLKTLLSINVQEHLVGTIGMKAIEAKRFLRMLSAAAEAAPSEPEACGGFDLRKPEPEPEPDPREPSLRAELAELKLSQLKKRARDMGVDEDTIVRRPTIDQLRVSISADVR